MLFLNMVCLTVALTITSTTGVTGATTDATEGKFHDQGDNV
jgi:hypothetical protein